MRWRVISAMSRVVVNDLLMYLGPLRGLFVPVNKHGRQDAGSVEAFNNAFASRCADSDLPRRALFAPPPRGRARPRMEAQFREEGGRLRPGCGACLFQRRLSDFFYRLSNLRTVLGIKANIEMLYLADEMFRQAGSDFEIIIGRPIPSASLLEGRTPGQAADYVRRAVYALGRG